MDRIEDMKAFIERMRTEFNDKLDELDQHNSKIWKKSNCVHLPRYDEYKNELNDEDRENIRKFYVNAPEGYHVDHIIPLCQGGRHHVSNLQYLTPEQNREKGRTLDWGPNRDGRL